MARIFWDTNIFIYLFENKGPLGRAAQTLRQKMIRRQDQLVTAWMSLAELQVQPRLLGAFEKADAFREAIQASAELVAFNEESARAFVEVRLHCNAKGPDAIQLACAAAQRCDVFVTNDRELVKMQIPGIHFITTMEGVPF